MTSEELETAIREVEAGTEKLSNSDKPLTKEEKKRQQLLLFRKEILCRIKDAREKNRRDAELHNAMLYGLSTSWLGKHPYLLSVLVSLKFGGRIF